jgi:hypothetical protein
MASLTGNLVAETYKALLKTIDNDILTASEKQITDGFGGGSNVFIDSNGFLRANKYKVTNGLATQFLKADGSLDANTYLTSITSSQIITALGYTPVTNARTLTINGTTYDLSANRSWTIAGTAAVWGNISGTLSDQTDLQTALNAKFNNPTGTISQYIRGDGTLATFPAITGFVPYTGATQDVDLGTHTLLARDLVIDHASSSGTAVDITKGGSGIAVNIEKSGSGEALTVVKSSGSGNAASITGGTTLISELHLTTKLADAYISSAATWNAKQNALNGTGFVKVSGTTITYDNSTYLTTANAALTYLALTGGTLTGSITATSFVKEGGTSNEYLRADGSVNVITGDIISGSGTAGYIAKFGSSAVIASSNLFESGANIGFGTITLNYGSYGRAFTGAGFGSTSFGFEAVTGSTTNGGLIGGLSLVIASNDSTRRIGSAIQSYISGATSTHQGADLRFFVKPDNAVLLEVVRMTSAGITFNKDLTAANITATTFVKSGGTASEFLMADGSVSTFSSPVSGSGSAGYIPKWTSASNLGQSFMYDDGTSIGIAYTTPNKGGYGRALSGASFGSASFGFEAVSNTTTNGGLIGGLSFIVNQNDSSRIVGSAIQSNLVGTTATNYGADLRFFAKADGVFTIAEVARMTSAGLRVYGTIVKDGGTSSQYLMADGSVSTGIANTITGSLTSGYIPKATGANTLGNSIIYDNGSAVGIGATTLARKLEVITGSGITDGIRLTYANGVGGEGMDITYLNSGATTISFDSIYNSAAAVMQFRMKTAATPVTAMTIFGSGNISINNTTDSGYKFDVSGTSRFSDTIILSGANNRILSGNELRFYRADNGIYTKMFDAGNNAANGFVLDNMNGEGFHFKNGGNTIMRMPSNGFVGIGINSPEKLLTLYSSVGSLDTGAVIRLIGNAASDLVDFSVADTKTRIYHQENSADADAGYGMIQLRTNAAPNPSFRTRGGFQFTVGSTDAMTISNTYTIGMGITPDAAKLSIQGVSNEWALSVWGSSTTSQSYGGIIRGGTNSNDISFRINNAVNSTTYFTMRGDGLATYNNMVNISSTSSISAPSSGKSIEMVYRTDGSNDYAFIQTYDRTNSIFKQLRISGNSLVLNGGGEGNVLINTTTNSGYRLDVNGTGRFNGTLQSDNSSTAELRLRGGGYGTNYNTSLRSIAGAIGILQFGNNADNYILVGNTAGGGYLDVRVNTSAESISSGSLALRIASNATATFYSNLNAVAFFETSDFRLKKLIEHNPIVDGIENLQAKLYEKNGKIEMGYFAQDAEKLMPYAVTKNEDGFLNLSYREVHTAKIARLEQRVAELEKQLNLN